MLNSFFYKQNTTNKIALKLTQNQCSVKHSGIMQIMRSLQYNSSLGADLNSATAFTFEGYDGLIFGIA